MLSVLAQTGPRAEAWGVDAFLSRPGHRSVPEWPRGAVTASEARLGVPTFYWAPPDPLSRPPRAMGLTAAEAARRHLFEHSALYRGDAARWARTVDVAHEHDTGVGAVIVSFQQRLDGVRVFRDEVKVVMDRDLRLVAVSGYLTPEIAARGSFSLDASAAVAAAWQLETGTYQPLTEPTSPRPDAHDYVEWVAPDRWARARPVLFPLADGVEPAYSIELETERGGTAWVISASDGTALFRKDLSAAHDYLVFADPVTKYPLPGPQGSASHPHPTGRPDGTWFSSAAQALVTLEHAGVSTNDPWLAPGAAYTRGNHVQAYTDMFRPEGFTVGADQVGTVSAPDAFSYVWGLGDPYVLEIDEVRSGIVQLFYVTNFLHDWFYDVGFDERAGNAQLSNFQRGGAENDVLRAETFDYSWSNNADMLTPADGRSPRMQMYGWRFPYPWRDGAVDTGLVAHEYGHYVSNRLIGNATGLSNHQGYGLGEGWSDFHAQLLLVTEDDLLVPSNANWQGTWAIAPFAVYRPDSLYFGVRRFPISTDFAKNPLTFKHIQWLEPLPTSAPIRPNYAGNQEVHNTGEVWAVMLWECYAALLRDPRYSFEQARDRMKRYLIAAYKATPLTPTFLEARDALLAVAAAQDADDYLALWRAFARRGIGSGSTGPDRHNGDNLYVSESYTVANSVRLLRATLREATPNCDADRVLDADEAGELVATVRNLGTQPLTQGQATLEVSSTNADLRFPGGTTVPVPVLAPLEERDLVVPLALGHVLGPHPLEVTLKVSGTGLFPPSSSSTLGWRVNVDEQADAGIEDEFEAQTSTWTAGADARLDTTAGFQRVEVTTTQHFWAARPGPAAADLWLVSPPLSVGSAPLSLSFLHRYELERDADTLHDGAVLELSRDDGATWADIGATASPGYVGALAPPSTAGNPLGGRRAYAGRSPGFPAFMRETVDLGTAWANEVVRLRFRLGTDDALRLGARGWEIDEVRVSGLTNTPFARLVSDPNRCSNTAPVAHVGAGLTLSEGERVVLEGSGTDAEGDPLTLTWTQVSGPTGALSGNVFVAPEVTEDGSLTLELVAHDGRTAGAPAPLEVRVRNVNRPPVVTVSTFQRAAAGERVTLTGTARDSDGDALVFAWAQVAGPAVSLAGADSATVSFEAPALEATARVVLELVASDGKDASAPGRTVVEIAAVPTPEAPPPEERPTGCGCSAGTMTWTLIALLAWAGRVRRR